ncbi:pentapeptide repeat-containing protein [Methylocystis sp.]|uniref:pentapeptide repeat-containing protein n=1 Tax=Methylocystis sp. TaxID=1911079 RepID=UPI003DA6B708
MVDDEEPPIEPEPLPRRRKAPPGTKLPPIATKANDLESIKKAVEDAAAVSGGLWLSYLFVLFYIAVAAGAVTHADLLLETPVKLPFLNDISLPLKAFFFLAPFLFLIMHAYTLAHFVLLADKVRRFHDELHAQIAAAEDVREALRRQLPSNVFVQFLAGPKDIRVGGPGWLLKVTAWTTLVFGPILLLLLLQIQFLPYHDAWITWTHRLALLADFVLLCWLWPKVLHSRDELRGWRWWTSWAKSLSVLGLGLAVVIFAWTVATFPGEWQEDHLPSFAVVPTKWFGPEYVPQAAPGTSRIVADWISLHQWVFDGDVDLRTRRRASPLTNTLILPGFNIYQALKVDDPKKIEWKNYLIDLRGRDLKGAAFQGAILIKIDLSGAQLQDASFLDAMLRETSFSEARLDGASLRWAQFQGSSLHSANLRNAELIGANAHGADFDWADLQDADLSAARLQGASFNGAQLQGASLDNAQLQGVSFEQAQLRGASLDGANLLGVSFLDADHDLPDESRQAISIGEANAEALANSLGELVCDGGPNGIFILRGILNNGRLEAMGAKASKLAERIQSKDCPVSTTLTERDKENLRLVEKEAKQEAVEKAVTTHPVGKPSRKKK